MIESAVQRNETSCVLRQHRIIGLQGKGRLALQVLYNGCSGNVQQCKALSRCKIHAICLVN